MTFEDRKPALLSISMTKKYRKQKAGVMFYKSGSGWRKRFVEITGGFVVVHNDSAGTLITSKASNYITPPSDSEAPSVIFDSPVHRKSTSGKQLKGSATNEHQGRKIRMLAALEGCACHVSIVRLLTSN